MNGTLLNYDEYIKKADSMEDPGFPQNIRFDMKGLVEYSKKKGVEIINLSQTEKMMFVTTK